MNALPGSDRYVKCRTCGQVCHVDEIDCETCGTVIDPERTDAPHDGGELRPGSSGSPLTFSLSSLMLFMVFVSVGLGLTLASPWVGIPFWILGTMSYFRTAWQVRIRRDEGKPLTVGEMIGDFLVGMPLSAAVLAGGAAAGYVTFMAFFAFVYSAPDHPGIVVALMCLIGLNLAAFMGIFTISTLGYWLLGRKPHATKEDVAVVRCPKCGAANRTGGICWMCGTNSDIREKETGIDSKSTE